MKKIINYFKDLIRKFTSRPKLTEVYIISTTYQYIKPVVEFLEKRKQWCEKEGVEFRLQYFPFLNTKKCGELILYLNDEKVGSYRLFVDNGIVFLKSYGKLTYTTDVAHCMGCGCPKKDKCYRYWLRKELCKRYVNNTLQSLEYPPHVEEQYDFETEECEMFKPLE